MFKKLLLSFVGMLVAIPLVAYGSALGAGTNDYLTATITTDIPAVGITIAAKVRYTVHPASVDDVVVLADTNASQSSSVHLRLSGTDDRFDCATFDTGGTADSANLDVSAAEYDDVWVSIVCTFVADADRTVYAGIPAGSETPSNNAQSSDSADTLNNIRLFENFVGGGDMAGRIAEVAIWTEVLDSTEIEQYIDNECTANIAPASLAVYYPLVDDADDFANDGLDTTGDLTVTATVTIDADHPTMGSCSAPAASFGTNPSVTAETTDTYTLSYNTDDADNFFSVAVVKDSTAPTCDEIEANTAPGEIVYATEAATNNADTIDLAIPGGDPFPLYDVHACAEGAGGDSSVVSLPDETLDEPTARAYFIKSGAPTPPEVGMFDDASPAAVDGDYGDVSECADSFELGACAHVLTPAVDTTFDIASGGDLSQIVFTRRFYDVSVGDWSDPDPVAYAINNLSPIFIGLDTTLLFIVDETLDFPLDSLWLDPEDDLITHGITNNPAGGAVTGGETLTGAYTGCGIFATVQLTATDFYGDDTDQTLTFNIGAEVPEFTGDTEAAYVAEAEALCSIQAVAGTARYDNVVPAGSVVDVSPVVGEFLEFDATITYFLSLGVRPPSEGDPEKRIKVRKPPQGMRIIR